MFVDHFLAAGYRTIGLLGTRSVMLSHLHGLQTVEVVSPRGPALDAVHACYTAMSLAGAASPQQRSRLQEAGRTLHRERGVDAVLLGGADLSLAFDPPPGDYPVLDGAVIHAEAIARAAMA